MCALLCAVAKALAGLQKAAIHVEERHNVTVPGTLTTPGESLRLLNLAITETRRLSLYVGINVCAYLCQYCRYGNQTAAPERLLRLIQSKLEELAMEMEIVSSKLPSIKSATVSSLYIGGGTPSLMSETQLSHLLENLRHYFQLSPQTEITLEGTPNTLTPANLIAFKRQGVNRISCGVQRLNDAWLSQVGRHHSVSEALNSLQALQGSGIRFNVDLMYGFADQTLESFLEDIKKVLEYAPNEVTIYRLEVQKRRGDREILVARASSTAAYQMWVAAREVFRDHGYLEGPASWFTRQGQGRAQVYIDRWQTQIPLLGLGYGAYSFSCYQQHTNLSSVGQPDPAKTYCYSKEQQKLRRMVFELKARFKTRINGEVAFFENLEETRLGRISSGDVFRLNLAGKIAVEEIIRALIEKSGALGQSAGKA